MLHCVFLSLGESLQCAASLSLMELSYLDGHITLCACARGRAIGLSITPESTINSGY